MKSNYKPIGKYIRLVDERNKGLQVQQLLGLSISKQFIPSVANTVGTDMENYKIIHRNQFACSTMQVRRDKKMPVALLKDLDKAIISQAYPIFEVKDEKELLPKYLMMWFERSEFDREACFHAVGGVRGSLEWEDFENMQLPIPSIEKQREIVAEYNTIQNRITLNQQLIKKLEETAQAIYREWFVENRDESWEIKRIDEIAQIKAGGDKPQSFSETKTRKYSIPIFANGVTNEGLYGYTDKAVYPEKSITISARGTIGYCVLRNEPFVGIVRLLVLIPFNKYEVTYLIDCLKQVEFSDSGSVQSQLTIPQVSTIEIVMPSEEILKKYDDVISKINNQIELKKQENQKLSELKELVLSKLATL